MSSQISCPQCNYLIDPQSQHCSNCGVNLALATILTETALTLRLPITPGLPLAPEALIPRLGDYLIEKGILEPDDLERALEYQRQEAEAGEPILIGQALVALGLIDQPTLDEAVTEQILQLQSALQKSNQELEQRVQERTAELQQALNRLTELNQLKSNFISNISHELRTPLTHIKGYSDILVDQSLGPLNKKQVEALRVIKRSEIRLERLIDDLIQFSLAARGELTIYVGDFHLGQLITNVISQVLPKANANNLSLQMLLPEDPVFIRADEEKINWVILQLLENAIKFTPEYGRIVVEVKVDGDLVTTSVRDTGIGIPKERLNEIFDPFHQLDSSITRKYSGTGLGLSMVRRILESHGTDIKVKSNVGSGSEFQFSLPKAEQNNAT